MPIGYSLGLKIGFYEQLTSTGQLPEGGWKWHGGTANADGIFDLGLILAVSHEFLGSLHTPHDCPSYCPPVLHGDWCLHCNAMLCPFCFLLGTVIYGFPNHSDTVLKIDTTTDTVGTHPPHRLTTHLTIHLTTNRAAHRTTHRTALSITHLV